MDTMTVPVHDARLEVVDEGAGEPVVFIQTALVADELLPVASDPQLARYRRILYHRRGYAGSSPAAEPGSVTRDTDDCAALLRQLGLERAHVVGLSFSGAIALQLAADHPDLVHSLVLIEPPPVCVPDDSDFRAANQRLLQVRHREGLATAFEEFMVEVVGDDWVELTEAHVPGAVSQMRQDAATFFDIDIAALLDWEFTSRDAARVTAPVLYVGGTDSGPWFDEVASTVASWFPDDDQVLFEGADHSLALTHAPQIARAIADHVRHHAIDGH